MPIITRNLHRKTLEEKYDRKSNQEVSNQPIKNFVKRKVINNYKEKNKSNKQSNIFYYTVVLRRSV